MIFLVIWLPFLYPSLHSLLAGAHFHQIQDPLGWESAFSSCAGLVLPAVYVSLPWSLPPLEFQSKETSAAHSVDYRSALPGGEHYITGILSLLLLNVFFAGSGFISFFFFLTQLETFLLEH